MIYNLPARKITVLPTFNTSFYSWCSWNCLLKKVTWFKTATRRLEERLPQFFFVEVGPVIVTVGKGLVGVDSDPWLCLDVELLLLGRLLAVEDLIMKKKNKTLLFITFFNNLIFKVIHQTYDLRIMYLMYIFKRPYRAWRRNSLRDQKIFFLVPGSYIHPGYL